MAESTFDNRLQELMIALDTLRTESDLGTVVLTASYFDQQLEIILKSYLADRPCTKNIFEGPNSALTTFSSKIGMSYALNLIDKREFDSLSAIRKIRNVFAHNVGVTLESEKVTSIANPLAWSIGRENIGDHGLEVVFFLSSHRLAMQLLNRADHVRAVRILPRDWPRERTDRDVWDGSADPLGY